MRRRSEEDWRRMVSSMLEDLRKEMREERGTDLILYSSERIPVPVHRMILSQSPHLRALLTSLSCCQGRCAHQEPLSILLPDFSWRVLWSTVNFLYTGSLQFRQEDRLAVSVGIISHQLVDIYSSHFRTCVRSWVSTTLRYV